MLAPSRSVPVRVAILLHCDYWRQRPTEGNGLGYRSVLEISTALEAAGAQAAPVYHKEALDLSGFDALVLPGGGDLDPRFYGQLPGPGMAGSEVDRDLDAFQLAGARQALATGMPVLGLCRGMQVLNVAAGGTLLQHVPGHTAPGVLEDPGARRRPAHAVRVRPGSRMHRILGARRVQVNSIHHQALDRVASGFVVTALAEDGVVEAFERTAMPWQRGVQFHPEDLRHTDPRFGLLFESLVDEARAHRSGTL